MLEKLGYRRRLEQGYKDIARLEKHEYRTRKCQKNQDITGLEQHGLNNKKWLEKLGYRTRLEQGYRNMTRTRECQRTEQGQNTARMRIQKGQNKVWD